MTVVLVAHRLLRSLRGLLLAQTARGRGSVPENLCYMALSQHSHRASWRGAVLEVNKEFHQYSLGKGKGRPAIPWAGRALQP